MHYFDWDEDKNSWLQEKRNISFNLCVLYIEKGYVLDIIANKSPKDYQKVFILNIEGYASRVPFVEDEEKIFLKTAYPCRKDTKKYM